jgi:hypothetical protein
MNLALFPGLNLVGLMSKVVVQETLNPAHARYLASTWRPSFSIAQVMLPDQALTKPKIKRIEGLGPRLGSPHKRAYR